MPKYFMSGTRYAAYERMMMEVPRRWPAEKPRDREKKGILPPTVRQVRSENERRD